MSGFAGSFSIMSSPFPTHYETLGVSRRAKNTDITRAYQRLQRANQRDEAPPDLKRDARIREAYETLSDLDRREAYDSSLVVKKTKAGARLVGASVVGALVVTSGVVLYLNRTVDSPQVAAKPLRELGADAARSVGRVRSIEVSGQAVDTGLAFVIGEEAMATTCAGLKPGAQIVVEMPSRNAPARLTETDTASGLCKLAIDGGAGWPLPLSRTVARTGEKVYAARSTPAGTILLAEGMVQDVRDDSKGRVIHSTLDLAADASGGPLLDASGRVVGIAAVVEPNGRVRHVPIPEAWTQPKAVERAPARNVEPLADPAAATLQETPEAGQGKAAKSPIPMSAERKEELRKAFRPDPNLPPDL
jgi:hypothetical protein